MRHFIKFSYLMLAFATILYTSCVKEDLQYTGQTTNIDLRPNSSFNMGTVPNCTSLNPADFPATGAAVGKVVVNGRALLPDGKPAMNTSVWFFERLSVLSRKVTDANGRFSFEAPADTAQSANYYVVLDPSGSKRLIGIQNCRYNTVMLEKNRIQNLEIKSCFSTLARIKMVNKTKADSAFLTVQHAISCDTANRNLSVGFGNWHLMAAPDDLVNNHNTRYPNGYEIRFAKDSRVLLLITRKRNGSTTIERKAVTITNDNEEILVEL
jgi:hypothetical protein